MMNRDHSPQALTRRQTTMALALSCLLAACGGGSSEPVAQPPPAATTAPQITAAPLSATVGEGATALFGVSASGTPTLTYQWLQDGVGALADATSASLTIAPVRLQDEGKRYGVSVANAQGSVTSPWATLGVTERAWASAAMPPTGAVSSGAANSYDAWPPAMVDSRGHTHALFNQVESSGAVTMWSAFKPATSEVFTTFSRLSSASAPANLSTQQPVLGVDNTGRVLAVWIETVGDAGFKQRTAIYLPQGDGGQWSAAADVSDTETAPQYEPAQIAASGDGGFEVALLAYRDSDNTYLLQSRQVAADNSGGPAVGPIRNVTSNLNGSIFRPRLVGNGQGRMLMAWTVGADGFAQTQAAVRAVDGNWSAVFEADGIDNADMTISHTAMNAAGQGVIVMNAAESRIYARRFELTGDLPTWLDAQPPYVANHVNYNALDTAVVMDASGRIHIVSIHGNGYSLSRWQFNGLGWLELDAVRDVTGSPLSLPVLSQVRAGLDAANNLIVTWAEASADQGTLLKSRRHHAGLQAWRAESVVQSGVFTGAAGLAVQADGSATAVFSTGSAISAARFR